jgi:hypothetical protein
MPNFYVVGLIEPSNTGRAYKVYQLVEGKKVFIGLINKKALAALLHQQTPFVEVCKFSEKPGVEQEPINFFSVGDSQP